MMWQNLMTQQDGEEGGHVVGVGRWTCVVDRPLDDGLVRVVWWIGRVRVRNPRTFENDSSPTIFGICGGLSEWGGRYWSMADDVAVIGAGVLNWFVSNELHKQRACGGGPRACGVFRACGGPSYEPTTHDDHRSQQDTRTGNSRSGDDRIL